MHETLEKPLIIIVGLLWSVRAREPYHSITRSVVIKECRVMWPHSSGESYSA